MRVRLVLFPIIVAAAFLAGCTTQATTPPAPTDNGVAALSADEILTKARAALTAAPFYTLKGEVTEEANSIKIDLEASGANKKASITSQGSTIEVLIIGTDLYFKAPDELLASFIPAEQQSVLALLKGKYIKVSTTDSRFTDLSKGLEPAELLKSEGTLSKGDRSTIDGTPVIQITDTKDGKVNWTLAVATQGEPRPVQISGAPGEGDAKFNYTEAVVIAAPAATDVFDLKSLLGG
jgi:hypothetical protein